MGPAGKLLLAAALALGAGLALPTVGGAAEGVPFPEIGKAQGEACVRDTAFMRRNHMTLLKHQRDETVHRGLRPRDERLQSCLTCHAVRGAGGQAVGFDSPKHFCRTCHDYAAVRIDCFECHAARPEAGAGVQLSKGGEPR